MAAPGDVQQAPLGSRLNRACTYITDGHTPVPMSEGRVDLFPLPGLGISLTTCTKDRHGQL